MTLDSSRQRCPWLLLAKIARHTQIDSLQRRLSQDLASLVLVVAPGPQFVNDGLDITKLRATIIKGFLHSDTNLVDLGSIPTGNQYP